MADLLVFQYPVTGTGSLVFSVSTSGPGSAPDVLLSCAGGLSELDGSSGVTARLPSGQLSIAGPIADINGGGHVTASLPPARISGAGSVAELGGSSAISATRPAVYLRAAGLVAELAGEVRISAPTSVLMTVAGSVAELGGSSAITAMRPAVYLCAAGLVAELDGESHISAPASVLMTVAGLVAELCGSSAIVTKRPEFRIGGAGLLGELEGSSMLVYDSHTDRPLAAGFVGCWGTASVQQASKISSWAKAQFFALGIAPKHQIALSLDAACTAAYGATAARDAVIASGFQAAEKVRGKDVGLRYQAGVQSNNSVSGIWQIAQRIPACAVSIRHQAAIKQRSCISDVWMQAAHASQATSAAFEQSLALAAGFGAQHGNAWVPRPGRESALIPPIKAACYIPLAWDAVGLVFSEIRTSVPELIFVCECKSTVPAARIVVPFLKSYMTINSIILRRVDGDIPIPAYAFSMSLDYQSWTWSWSASIALASLPVVKPGSDGLPIEIEAVINGVPYRLACEGFSSQKQFASGRIGVKGRGLSAVLDAPYAPVLNFASADARSAQQLMQGALTINGVSIGWELDWGLTDWLVPGNTWTHQGAYISAITAIAQAAGGYVQPHNTAKTLRILPSYPTAPWAWADVTPGVELPSAVVTVEGIDWTRKPDYNRVFVSGMSNGVLGQVTRAGTAGDSVAPMITDALITHADAARQRGLSVLSDTGAQERINLTLPVLAETGLITPGQFVRYVDSGSTTRMGLVRSTNLTWALPKMRQTLSIETHV